MCADPSMLTALGAAAREIERVKRENRELKAKVRELEARLA